MTIPNDDLRVYFTPVASIFEQYGRTALHIAAASEFYGADKLRILLEKRADPNAYYWVSSISTQFT